jgi:hypothetical protein
VSEAATSPIEPYRVGSAKSPDFKKSSAELLKLMKLPADALGQLRDGFWTVADERGIDLLSNAPDAVPALTVEWPLVGPMRSESLKRVPFASRLRLDLVMVGVRVYPGTLFDFPVLCIPVTVDGRSVELPHRFRGRPAVREAPSPPEVRPDAAMGVRLIPMSAARSRGRRSYPLLRRIRSAHE